MQRKTKKTIVAAGLSVVAAVGLAETDSQFSDDQLHRFAEARAEVKEVLDSYRNKRSEVSGKEQLQELRRQMQDAMASAVRDNGLSVKAFNDLTRAVRRDHELRQRLSALTASSERDSVVTSAAN